MLFIGFGRILYGYNYCSLLFEAVLFELTFTSTVNGLGSVHCSNPLLWSFRKTLPSGESSLSAT